MTSFFCELSLNYSTEDCSEFINSFSLFDKTEIDFAEFEKIVLYASKKKLKRDSVIFSYDYQK